MGYDKDNAADLQICKMLIDLKVTNEIHSSEFAKAYNILPIQMEITRRHAWVLSHLPKKKGNSCFSRESL